jgi:hypothetical protein
MRSFPPAGLRSYCSQRLFIRLNPPFIHSAPLCIPENDPHL